MTEEVKPVAAKVGDRVSLDSLKVGQIRRTGIVQQVTEGLSGTRYLVRWDDGHESFFKPSAGNLIVESSGEQKEAGGAVRATGKGRTAKTPRAKAAAAKGGQGRGGSGKSTAKGKR